MNILISGSTGFIGSYLIKDLVEQSHNIYAIVRKMPQHNSAINFIMYNGDYHSLRSSVKDLKIDAILNLATHFCVKHTVEDIDPLVDTNLRLGLQLLELSSELKINFFITASTYAQSIDGSAYNPQNLYSATKQAFETLMEFYIATSKTTKYITLELSDTYGPNDPRKKFINLAIDACKRNEEFRMSPGDQEINYIYIDDVVKGFLNCLDLLQMGKLESGDKYSLSSNEVYTLNQLVKIIWRAFEKEPKIVNGFYPYRQREIMKLSRRYPRLPDWEPVVNIKEGIGNLSPKSI